MRNLNLYVKECIKEMENYGIDVSKLPDIEWKVNTRAKKRFGQCIKRNGKWEINISYFMLDENILKDDHHLKDTIIHEILHALTPSSGHKGTWRELARQINIRSKGKYDIKRCGSFKEMGITNREIIKPPKVKYILRCDCGDRYYARSSKKVRHPGNWFCRRCQQTLRLIS